MESIVIKSSKLKYESSEGEALKGVTSIDEDWHMVFSRDRQEKLKQKYRQMAKKKKIVLNIIINTNYLLKAGL